MKVKTFKRMSKRFISTLLSVLMVVSLFTVCAVGSATTASAGAEEWDSDGVTNGKVTFDASATDWTDTVYLYIGRKYTYDKEQVYTARYEMTRVGTSNVWECTVSWGPYTTFFFSTDSSKGDTGSAPDSIYSNIADSSKTALIEVADGFKLSGSGSTFTASGTAPYAITDGGGNSTGGGGGGTTTYYLDTTLFNYRNDQQIYDTGDNAKSTDEITMLAVDKSKPMSEHVQNGHMYLHYNNAVSTWFSSRTENLGYDIETGEKQNFTPLYEGNFHDLTINKDPWSNNKWYNWVMVANAANRYNHTASRNWSSNGDNIKTAAQNLVDDKMSNLENPREGTITQNGVELPQFSDTFITESKDSSGRYLQTKYPNLSFPVKATKNSHQNTWYSYNSLTDGNRYLNIYKESNGEIVREIKKGKVELTGVSGEAGYYPFNDDVNEGLVNSHGTRFDIDFVMPANGTGIVNTEALQFNFTGDDDLWVYIDGYLALDLGGSHNVASGSINLADKKSYIKTGVYNADYNSVSNKTGDGVPYNDGGKNTSDNKFESIPTEFSNELKASLADTTKIHTMTIFYMERGQYDSNLSFSFMLPQTNSLTVKQDIDTSDVNKGLVNEALKIAEKDVHQVKLETNSATSTKDNDTAVLPIPEDFIRVDNDGNEITLQKGVQAENTKRTGNKFENKNNVTGSEGWSTVGGTTFVWNDENLNSSGIGTGKTGTAGEINLLYNQSATFIDQFVTESGMTLIEADNLQSFKLGDGVEATTLPPETNSTATRKSSDYYTKTLEVKDNLGNKITTTGDSGTKKFLLKNGGTTNSPNAKLTATYTNTVNTGKIEFQKSLETGTVADNVTFYFTVKFAEVFGGSDTSFKDYDVIYSKYDLNGNQILKENNYFNVAEGIELQAGQKAVIEGVPVGTKYQIVEKGANNTNSTVYTATVLETSNTKTGSITERSDVAQGVSATVGTGITGENNVASYDFHNTDKKTTVYYRYHDRNVTTGIPTAMEKHYTYFTKELPGNMVVTSSTSEAVINQYKNTIERYAPDIKNVLSEYSLSLDNIQFNTTVSDADGEGKVPTGSVILATYTDTPKEYNLVFEYVKPGENKPSIITPKYYFNNVVELGDIQAAPSYIDDNGDKQVFSYWAKEVPIDNLGNKVYTPVSTNFSYAYRVTEEIKLKAVYNKDTNKTLEAPFVADDAAYHVQNSGFDAVAAERVYDAYSKDNTDRTRVNVMFSSAGSMDLDENITHVGYILIKNEGSYLLDEQFINDNTSSNSLLKQLENGVVEDNGVVNKNVIQDKNGNNRTAQIRLYKVKNRIANEEGWEDKYVNGTTTLTNKNRLNFVFDKENKPENQTTYYTCYTIMSRVTYKVDDEGKQILDADNKPIVDQTYRYVSDTPAYFNLGEADANYKEVQLDTTSYTITKTAKDTTGTKNDSAGSVQTNRSNVKDGQDMVITVTPTNYIDATTGTPMTSTLEKLQIGNVTIEKSEFEDLGIKESGVTKYTITFKKDIYVSDGDTQLPIIATFKTVENQTKVTVDVSKISCTNGKVYVRAEGSNVFNSQVITVDKGTKIYVLAVGNEGYELEKWGNDNNKTNKILEITPNSDNTYTIPTPTFKSSGKTVYLNANSIEDGNGKYAVWMIDGPKANTFATMTETSTGKVYSVLLPNDCTKIIFLRYSKDATEPHWGWGQTATLVIPNNGATFTANSNSNSTIGGSW